METHGPKPISCCGVLIQNKHLNSHLYLSTGVHHQPVTRMTALAQESESLAAGIHKRILHSSFYHYLLSAFVRRYSGARNSFPDPSQ